MSDLATMWSSLRLQLDAHRPEPASSRVTVTDRAIPVTILTGFLGAGKSTLLAALLTDPIDGLTVRAVVNDVGSLPFDPTLISAADQVEIELTNGCGCCERAADLATTLDRVAERATTDLIVLEASGVADPLALAQVVEARPALRVDRIVAAVDGLAVERHLTDPMVSPIIRRQLDAAHGVVVTNTEALAASDLERLVDIIAGVAPGRVVTVSTLAEPAAAALTPSAVRGARPMPPPDGVEHDLPSITITQRGPIRLIDLERALAARPAGIVRGKGRLLLDDGYAVVQLTSTSTSIEPADEGPCGFTIVATSTAEAAVLAGLLMAQ